MTPTDRAPGTEMRPETVWSYGGGVQSAAIAVLIRQEILPKPNIAVIADTGREHRSTWEYMREVVQPYLEPTGLVIEVAPHSLAGQDIYAGNGDMLMPAYTTEGRLPTFCSGSWKRDVIERWIRKEHPAVENAEMWIGFSWDERDRRGKPHRDWLVPTYPLCDRLITRLACLAIIEKAGLPTPPKSRCWMCPHQNAEEWAEIRADAEEWKAAVALDKRIRDTDETHSLYLHSSRVPLEQADLTVDDRMPLLRACQDTGCWT